MNEFLKRFGQRPQTKLSGNNCKLSENLQCEPSPGNHIQSKQPKKKTKKKKKKKKKKARARTRREREIGVHRARAREEEKARSANSWRREKIEKIQRTEQKEEKTNEEEKWVGTRTMTFPYKIWAIERGRLRTGKLRRIG